MALGNRLNTVTGIVTLAGWGAVVWPPAKAAQQKHARATTHSQFVFRMVIDLSAGDLSAAPIEEPAGDRFGPALS